MLFPKGLVSPTQERQLTCWGGNVRSFAVRGTFDDCQRLVKEAFVDRDAAQRASSCRRANSINLGRLLPQAVYYAATSLAMWREHGASADFVIPSGNLGNSVACVWARKIGPADRRASCWRTTRTAPCRITSRAANGGRARSIATLASAMDVGTPSNMERLRALFPDIDAMRGAVRAESRD